MLLLSCLGKLCCCPVLTCWLCRYGHLVMLGKGSSLPEGKDLYIVQSGIVKVGWQRPLVSTACSTCTLWRSKCCQDCVLCVRSLAALHREAFSGYQEMASTASVCCLTLCTCNQPLVTWWLLQPVLQLCCCAIRTGICGPEAPE